METNEVLINARNPEGGFDRGSGAVYAFGEQQYVITNAHVVLTENDTLAGFEYGGAFYMHVTAPRLGQEAHFVDNYILARVTAFVGCDADIMKSGGKLGLRVFTGYDDAAILEVMSPNENVDLYRAYAEHMEEYGLTVSNDTFSAFDAVSVKAYLDERPSRLLPDFILGKREFVTSGYPGGEHVNIEGHYTEHTGMFTLYDDTTEGMNPGISGATIVDSESGMPIGIVSNGRGDVGFGVKIKPVIEKLTLIEAARQAGVETYVTADMQQCAMGSRKWHHETFVDGQEVSPQSVGVAPPSSYQEYDNPMP